MEKFGLKALVMRHSVGVEDCVEVCLQSSWMLRHYLTLSILRLWRPASSSTAPALNTRPFTFAYTTLPDLLHLLHG